MVLLSFFLCATTVWGANYFVNPGESWNNRKTTLLPGDVLTFNPQTPGQPYTYTMAGTNSWTFAGEVGRPIIVQGAPGEKITLIQTAQQNVVELKGSYFVFQNLWLTVSDQSLGAIGLRLMPGTSHCVVNKITIYDIPETAFTANAYGATYDNVTFSNCEAYNVGGTGECFYVGCQSSGSTVACTFKNGFLTNNYCHDTCKPNACTGGSMGSGYQVKGWGSFNNVVKNNVCARVSQVCILLYDDFDLGPNIVDGNIIYDSVKDAGIQVCAGAIIRNNIIRGNVKGIVVSTNTNNLKPNSSPRNIVITGNTIVNNNGVGLKLPAFSGGSRISNNVVIEEGGEAFQIVASQGVTYGKNAYNGGTAPANGVSVGGSATVFVNAGASNYHPKAGSALLAAGSVLSASELTTDFDCVSRNSATPSLGAYESSSGPAAISSTFLPPCAGGSTPTAAQTSKPTGTPTTSRPTAAQTGAPATSTPTTSRPTNAQTSAPTTNKPTSTPTTSRPTNAITNAPTTGAPTNAAQTAAPSRAPTTNAPTLACAGINCGANGDCVEPNPVCKCKNDYTGSRCETPPVDKCVGNPPLVDCGAHGTCSAGLCTCRDNYSGTLCTTPPPATCTDGLKNSDEEGVDCGGTVAKCEACPTFYWKPNAWTQCSKTCGSGTHSRTVDCVNTATGVATTADKCAAAPHDYATMEDCNVDPCPTYSWKSGAWEACSALCGTGFRTRVVECTSSAGGVVVDASLCAAVKPTTQEDCNTVACVAPHWVSGTWSTCSFTCGGGTQTRTKGCFDADDKPVAESLCPQPAPTTTQPCNTDACVNYNWKACPTFYPCTAQCNGGGYMVGNQFRDVFCLRDSDGSAVDASLCNNATRPATLISICNTEPCTGYNWMADSNFGPCTQQANGLWQRFRTFHCHEKDGAIALRKSCEDNAGKLPIAVLPCTPGTCASPDGCPVVEIADVFNQCDTKLLASCIASTQCGTAANFLDGQMRSLGFSAMPASALKCVVDYVSSLPASDRPSTDLITYVQGKLTAGEPLCVGGISGAMTAAPSALVAVLLVVARVFSA